MKEQHLKIKHLSKEEQEKKKKEDEEQLAADLK